MAREFARMAGKEGPISEARLMVKVCLRTTIIRLLGMSRIGCALFRTRRVSILANHRVYASERVAELTNDPELTDTNVRVPPATVPREGVRGVEAPRGTLIQHYKTDEQGLITEANLIVATQHNSAPSR